MVISVSVYGENQPPCRLRLRVEERLRGGVVLVEEESNIVLGSGDDLSGAVADVKRRVRELNKEGIRVEGDSTWGGFRDRAPHSEDKRPLPWVSAL